jgi:hypothetical protein
VPNQNVLDPGVFWEGVIGREDRPAGIAEEDVNPLPG